MIDELGTGVERTKEELDGLRSEVDVAAVRRERVSTFRGSSRGGRRTGGSYGLACASAASFPSAPPCCPRSARGSSSRPPSYRTTKVSVALDGRKEKGVTTNPGAIAVTLLNSTTASFSSIRPVSSSQRTRRREACSTSRQRGENEEGERPTHLSERTRMIGRDERIGNVLEPLEAGEKRLEAVVELLDRLVRLSGRFEELGTLEERKLGAAVASLKDRAVGGLRVTGFASDLGSLEPKLTDLSSCAGVEGWSAGEKRSAMREEGEGKSTHARRKAVRRRLRIGSRARNDGDVAARRSLNVLTRL